MHRALKIKHDCNSTLNDDIACLKCSNFKIKPVVLDTVSNELVKRQLLDYR